MIHPVPTGGPGTSGGRLSRLDAGIRRHRLIRMFMGGAASTAPGGDAAADETIGGRLAGSDLALAALICRVMPVGAVRPAVDEMVRLAAVHRSELRRIHYQWFTASQTKSMVLPHRRL